MHRTTLILPDELRLRAKKEAVSRGVSFGALVREALEKLLGPAPRADSLVSDRRVFYGDVPPDLSQEHDKHLYGE